MGKLIYKPKGAAAEYCAWACNLYNGCTNGCTYCYNKRGLGSKLLGKADVTLKKDADLLVFGNEITIYRDQILADGEGLFFNFVSDPFLEETWKLNYHCANYAMMKGIPCVFLSKKVPNKMFLEMFEDCKNLVKVGFSLTGRDDLEPGASLNSERIAAMKYLSENGFHVWASIEPVINIYDSLCMIASAYRDAGCREFKIGLISGAKLPYSTKDIRDFYHTVNATWGADCDIMWKQSVMKQL